MTWIDWTECSKWKPLWKWYNKYPCHTIIRRVTILGFNLKFSLKKQKKKKSTQVVIIIFESPVNFKVKHAWHCMHFADDSYALEDWQIIEWDLTNKRKVFVLRSGHHSHSVLRRTLQADSRTEMNGEFASFYLTIK